MSDEKFVVNLEELMVLDNELYVTQSKLMRNLTVDGIKLNDREVEYKKIVDNLRYRIGQYLERQSVDRFRKLNSKNENV